MQPPDELMTETFLPAMRQLVARRLRSDGLSQGRISSLLGVTQASVSFYLSKPPARAYSALAGLSVNQEEAEGHAASLSEAVRTDSAEGVRLLMGIWTELLGSGSACRAHRAAYPSLADCKVCIEEYGLRQGARSQAITEVSEAVKMLEGSPSFVSAMPEVSVNLACVSGDSSLPEDVVAVPGRIVKVRDRAKAMLPPEAGASVHMSRILLLARRRNSRLRACINMRYDARMDAAMRRVGMRAIIIRGYGTSGSDPTAEAFEFKLKSASGDFNALVDEGGSGIEPNVYVFDKGAREVALLALRLARAYSAA